MSDTKLPRHLVGVWNPAYGTDVMESHIMLLRERAQKFRDGQEKEEDVYVWWGKIRSSRRQTALPHIDQILALEQDLGEDDGDAKCVIGALALIIGEGDFVKLAKVRIN